MTDRGFVCPRHEIFVKPGEMCRYCEPAKEITGAAAPQPLSDTEAPLTFMGMPIVVDPTLPPGGWYITGRPARTCEAYNPGLCGAPAAWRWSWPELGPDGTMYFCAPCHDARKGYNRRWTYTALTTVNAEVPRFSPVDRATNGSAPNAPFNCCGLCADTEASVSADREERAPDGAFPHGIAGWITNEAPTYAEIAEEIRFYGDARAQEARRAALFAAVHAVRMQTIGYPALEEGLVQALHTAIEGTARRSAAAPSSDSAICPTCCRPLAEQVRDCDDASQHGERGPSGPPSSDSLLDLLREARGYLQAEHAELLTHKPMLADEERCGTCRLLVRIDAALAAHAQQEEKVAAGAAVPEET